MPGSPARPISPSEYEYDRRNDWEALEESRPHRDAGGNIVGPEFDPTRRDKPDLWAYAPAPIEVRTARALVPELIEALRPVIAEELRNVQDERAAS